MLTLMLPSGIEHRRAHLAGHAEFIDRVNAIRVLLAAGNDARIDLDLLANFLTLFELIRNDFEMVGELRREGLLRA